MLSRSYSLQRRPHGVTSCDIFTTLRTSKLIKVNDICRWFSLLKVNIQCEILMDKSRLSLHCNCYMTSSKPKTAIFRTRYLAVSALKIFDLVVRSMKREWRKCEAVRKVTTLTAQKFKIRYAQISDTANSCALLKTMPKLLPIDLCLRTFYTVSGADTVSLQKQIKRCV